MQYYQKICFRLMVVKDKVKVKVKVKIKLLHSQPFEINMTLSYQAAA